MTRADIAREIIAVLESDQPHRVKEYITDDFVFAGPFPGPLDKEQFLKYNGAIKQAFPDWHYHFVFIRNENENTAHGIIQCQGTHKSDFSLPGMIPIPATDICVIMPVEAIHFIFQGEKLARLEVEDASGGGLEGILEQLRADLPHCLDGIFDKRLELTETENSSVFLP